MWVAAGWFMVLANVLIYVRKVILARRGYRVPWLYTPWSDSSKFVEVIESIPPSRKKKLLIALNFAPMTLFIVALFILATGATLRAEF